MINTQNLTPETYYKQSRDFQLIGRIFDFVFNYLKTNIDTMGNNPYSDNFDIKLVNLLATTLGFKNVNDYNANQLKALCSAFTYALRNKGNTNSIAEVLNILSNVENSSEKFIVETDLKDPYNLLIYIPVTLTDTTLLEDVLDYILPAGMTYTIISELLLETNAIKDNECVVLENEVSNFVSENAITAGLIRTADSSLRTGQVFRNVDAELPRQSDVEMGRIDNITVVRDTSSSGDVSAYVKETGSEQPTLYKHKVLFKSSSSSDAEVVITYCYEDTIILPRCMFIPESGKIFKEWDAGEVGSTYDISSQPFNVTITAVWQQSTLN